MNGNNYVSKKADHDGNGCSSIAGGYLPVLFGLDELMISLLGSVIGGIMGIWIGYKFSG